MSALNGSSRCDWELSIAIEQGIWTAFVYRRLDQRVIHCGEHTTQGAAIDAAQEGLDIDGVDPNTDEGYVQSPIGDLLFLTRTPKKG